MSAPLLRSSRAWTCHEESHLSSSHPQRNPGHIEQEGAAVHVEVAVVLTLPDDPTLVDAEVAAHSPVYLVYHEDDKSRAVAANEAYLPLLRHSQSVHDHQTWSPMQHNYAGECMPAIHLMVAPILSAATSLAP